MRSNAEPARGRPAAGALRRLRRRTSRWKRRAHDALVAALIAASAAEMPAVAVAQMGQMGMAPATGIANRAVQGFKGLNENGPGILYYGVNAADRGLGYVGSYMTLGGFVPGFQDDLGGQWAADLRGHLSVNGGFFSNVGAVRKQFLGGSLLGIGVYWDYDGDLNQYSNTTITDTSGSYVFGGGQVYNQVGISGEWLTDFGNLRSNGYIPVGTTAEYTGPFVGNSLLCENGVNAGLAGTDLEVGAYIPGLTDWAGMISVGGYAYGNSRYDLADGQDAVPWFGGVYTRLDMTFIENWDFSLQANNDSYFDWTGFARLTYRMGGSRRRNVPDQMEQPMMRNEHIVRAHRTPEVAINPETGPPWRVFHVDNSNAGAGVGAGTAASPYTALNSAQAAATNPYDIVYVHAGNSGVNPYITPAAGYSFNAVNWPGEHDRPAHGVVWRHDPVRQPSRKPGLSDHHEPHRPGDRGQPARHGRGPSADHRLTDRDQRRCGNGRARRGDHLRRDHQRRQRPGAAGRRDLELDRHVQPRPRPAFEPLEWRRGARRSRWNGRGDELVLHEHRRPVIRRDWKQRQRVGLELHVHQCDWHSGGGRWGRIARRPGELDLG